jgi:hypothetical protein
MSGRDERQGPIDKGDPTSRTRRAAPLTDEELRAVDAEPLPDREAMTTLLWAPGPASIAPPIDGLIDDESL